MNLPPIKNKKYFMAHSLNLAHPENFSKIQVNENLNRDDSINENQKDRFKIQNRDLSNEEKQNAYKMAKFTHNAPM